MFYGSSEGKEVGGVMKEKALPYDWNKKGISSLLIYLCVVVVLHAKR